MSDQLAPNSLLNQIPQKLARGCMEDIINGTKFGDNQPNKGRITEKAKKIKLKPVILI